MPDSVWHSTWRHARARQQLSFFVLVAALAGTLAALLGGHFLAIPVALLVAVLAAEASTLASMQLRRMQRGEEVATWRKASLLDLEPGFGLTIEQRHYRSWLWGKRLAQVVMLCAIVHALQSPTSMIPMGAVLWVAIVVAVVVERHLGRLRATLGLRSSGVADLELGACILQRGAGHV